MYIQPLSMQFLVVIMIMIWEKKKKESRCSYNEIVGKFLVTFNTIF